MITYTHKHSTESIEAIPSLPAIGSVIWLHGLGADGHDFIPIVDELHLPDTLPLRFIFPHAPLRPVTINNGYVMRAWFDIYSSQLAQRIDDIGINDAVKRVEKLIEHEEQQGISSKNIILAGFSQGSVIALMTGLLYLKPLAGILALSGLLPNAEQVIEKASAANRSIPIFIAHGTADNVVPFVLGEMTMNFLKKSNFPINAHTYPMAHTVCAEEVRDIANWMKEIY